MQHIFHQNNGHKKLLEKIRANFNRFSPCQKQIAAYITDNLNKTAFLTVDQLARNLSLSPSTIVRFAYKLGFSGYSEMQNNLRELFTENLSPVKIIEKSIKGSEKIADVINKSIELDVVYLEQSKREIPAESIERTIEILKSAEKIYIVGFRTSYGPAYLCNFILTQILNNSFLVSSGSEGIPEEVVSFKDKDVVLAFSFPRYSTQTFRIVNYAKSQNIKTIAVTDSLISPIGRLADIVIPCYFKGLTYQNTTVNAVSIVNVLTNCLVASMKPHEKRKLKKRIQKTETIFKEWDVLFLKQ